jgi:D-hydroxyproline dehydrogenase subunit gamma
MADTLRLKVNGRSVQVEPGTSVAAALLNSGVLTIRRSVNGEPRSALCGMGICFECRATVNGSPHARTCQILCRDGMEVTTE